MTKELQKIVDKMLSGTPVLLAIKICAGEGIGSVMEKTYGIIRDTYLANRTRGKTNVRPETRERWAQELLEAREVVERTLREQALIINRKRDIARIEYPLLSNKVREGMTRKGIPYLFRTEVNQNILTVQVTGEYFLDIPVTLENVDKVIGLVKYFIDRPDCAVKEMPGIESRKSYYLARSWNKVASSGSV